MEGTMPSSVCARGDQRGTPTVTYGSQVRVVGCCPHAGGGHSPPFGARRRNDAEETLSDTFPMGLAIGQSTLDSVLSAEARRYDAESREIHLISDIRVAQLSLLSAIGRLSKLVGL